MRCAIVLLLALTPGAAQGAAGDLVWFFQGIQDVNSIGEIEDQDSDGVPDIVLETGVHGREGGGHRS